MNTLLLFDIDGTLVQTGGAGARALVRAFADVSGGFNGLGLLSMAGRTDAWIIAQMFLAHGLEPTAARQQAVHDVYVQYLAEEIVQPGPRKGVLPGVRHLLDTLASQDDAYVALLTGNFRRGAEIKLEHFDLWRYFATGAFGDESQDRNELLWTAMATVKDASGLTFRPADVVIIGDTPLDVAVAVAGGARSVGVATGGYGVETLLASGADAAFPDLDDPERVLAALKRSR